MINTTQTINTKNLTLRTFREEDAESVQQLLSINKPHMTPWIPWAKNEPQSVETKKLQIKEWKESFNQNKKYIYGVYEHNSARLIGMMFMFTRRGNGSLEVGYIIDYRKYGKGYATEASEALTYLGFEVGAKKMLIYCDQANIASARIPKRIGYTHTSSEIEKIGKEEKRVMIWEMKNPINQNE